MTRLPTFEVRTAAIAAEADLVPVFQDSAKKAEPPQGRYAPVVQKLRKGTAFTARAGATQFLRFGGKGKAENAILIGFGSPSEVSEEKARSAGGHAWTKLCAEKVKTIQIDIDGFFQVQAKSFPELLSPVELVRPFLEGLVLGAYTWDKHRAPTHAEEVKYYGPTKVTVVCRDKSLKKEFEEEVRQVAATAESINLTREWSNEPPNVGTPEYYASEAKRLAKAHGLKCTILDEKAAARERMNLFLAVGRGSERESRVVVLEYNPPVNKNAPVAKTIALVGKGVTFDTGGYSIKPHLKMEDMKHDMTGAATVMGAMLLAAQWKIPNRVIAIMGFVENMVDGDGTVPGSVILSRAGKTVEINNTDAEGRLVLADLLDYAHDFKPDAVINIATLTGAISVALGKYNAGLFGNNDLLLRALKSAAEEHGEKLWELPVGDEYMDDLRSDTADMRNVGGDPLGGAIRGAVFLKQFIKPKMAWAHLDIASTAWGIGYLSYIPKRGASGLYVRTLAQLVAEY